MGRRRANTHRMTTILATLIVFSAIGAGGFSFRLLKLAIAQDLPIEVWSDYTLDRDIAFAGDGFIVKADNITLNLNGYSITGNSNGTGVSLSGVDSVTVKGGEISNFGSGILLEDSSNNCISENIVTANNFSGSGGIHLFQSSNNTIQRNNMTANYRGILLYGSLNNTVSENNVMASNWAGIHLLESSNNSISKNLVKASSNGIWLDRSPNNTVSGNGVTENNPGICLTYSSSNHISKNIATNNQHGILTSDTSDNSISENIVTANKYGIFIYGYSNNTVSGNNIIENNDTGIYVSSPYATSNTTIFHNDFVNNTNQVYIDPKYPLHNTWNDGQEGNYWSDYNERYPDAEKFITGAPWNRTAVWNTPYLIDEVNQDNYPLVFRWCSEDINRDGKINIADISIVAGAYGTSPGHERWHSRADLNGDGLVNITDIIIVATRFTLQAY